MSGLRVEYRNKKTSICTECIQKLEIGEKLKGNISYELDKSRFSSRLCICCEKDITCGNGGEIDYPSGIFVLLGAVFEGRGKRFGGVHPVINSTSQVEEVTTGVKRSKPLSTDYDQVVIRLSPEEDELFSELVSLLDKMSRLGRVRYKEEEINDGYLVTCFARH